MIFYLVLALAILFFVAYYFGSTRANAMAGGDHSKLHSRPSYHGGYLALVVTVPALAVLIFWGLFSGTILDRMVTSEFATQLADKSIPEIEAILRDARAIAFGGIVGFRDELKEAAAIRYEELSATATWIVVALVAALCALGLYFGVRSMSLRMRARHFVERFAISLLIACSAVAILTTIGIVFSLIFETARFFQKVPFFDFLFGLHWSPQSAFEAAGDQASDKDLGLVFGAVPLFAGTLLITAIAIFVAAPIGLMAAIYLSDYAGPKFRSIAKPVLETLAGIPTVVYGFFAALTVAPAIRGWGEGIGLSVSSESALAAGLVMGIMIIPFVSSLSDDVINSVPQSLREGSAGLGATKSETIRKVVLPAALPGIVSALLLAISRAVGETMIVVMAAGLAANLTINPLEAVTTVTVQIVTLLVGDQEFDSAKTLAAFALGLVLFCITLALNVIALKVVQKYREQYD